jgi:hypothetical protein
MAEPVPSEVELDREIDRAMRAGRRAARREPRARVARFDAATTRLVVELVNGATFMVPVSLLQGLAGASAAELAQVEVVPGGEALHWEALDVDLSVPGLLRGMFGTSDWMRRAGGKDAAAEGIGGRNRRRS